MFPLLDVIGALNSREVSYVVVGGMAVVLRGHLRMTVDLDLALDLSVANVEAAIDVLETSGFVPRLPVPARAFADPVQRQQWVRERHLVAFTMQDPRDARREVDLFADPPIPYAELSRDAERIVVADVPVRVASVAHLIAMKTIAGRSQDLADIEALRRLQP